MEAQNITIPPPLLPRERIIGILKEHEVRMDRWGTGTYRSLDDFIEYMTHDQFSFRPNGSPVLIVDVHTVVVIVTHVYNRRLLELYEDRQVFDNGHVIKRHNFNGIAETLERDESPRDGAMRCLAQELRFTDPRDYHLSGCTTIDHREPVPSEKWPGIMAAYHRYLFGCVISRRIFRSGGYVESVPGRKIYFKWKPRGQLDLAL